MDYPKITRRLRALVLVGGLMGLDRNLHGKPIGYAPLAWSAAGLPC